MAYGAPHGQPGPADDGMGTAALVVGAVALVVGVPLLVLFTFPALILGLVGLVLGLMERGRARRAGAPARAATIGIVLSAVALGFVAVDLAVWFVRDFIGFAEMLSSELG